ncbi:2892_t:CDS:2 [Acaulospora colombiana]|uniref:2892_t:CDS:1 n=1 Tax=Acaulospora colombiana TaxID=27376 RepID=A0ACA9NCZ9_9GLOM|nr:2892_t:CDS:2 [Acaulospora colombiana]
MGATKQKGNRIENFMKKRTLCVVDDGDTSRLLDGNGLALGGGTDGIRSLEDGFEFFKGTADSFDAKEVPEDGLDNVPSDEDEDVSVGNVLEGDGAGVQVDEGDQRDEDTVHGHTLGASLGGQALDGVEGLQRGIGEGVDDVEEEVGSQSTLSDLEVGDTNLGVVSPLGRETTVDGQHEGADKGTNDKDLAAGHAVSECDTTKSTNGRGDGIDQVEDELHVSVVADGLVDVQVEVSETVSGELTEDTHKSNHPGTKAGSVGLEELGVVPPALVRRIEFDTILEFLPLELDDWVVLLAITVVLGQEGAGLSITTVGEKPAGRLRKEPDGEDDDTSGDALEDQRKTPLHVILDLLGSEGDGGSCK